MIILITFIVLGWTILAINKFEKAIHYLWCLFPACILAFVVNAIAINELQILSKSICISQIYPERYSISEIDNKPCIKYWYKDNTGTEVFDSDWLFNVHPIDGLDKVRILHFQNVPIENPYVFSFLFINNDGYCTYVEIPPNKTDEFLSKR